MATKLAREFGAENEVSTSTSQRAGVRGTNARETILREETDRLNGDYRRTGRQKTDRDNMMDGNGERDDQNDHQSNAHSFENCSFIKRLCIQAFVPVAKLLDHRIFSCIVSAIQQ